MRFAIIISGLPASGKTTIGRALATALGVDYLDKDDFLETLFDEQGVGDTDWRRKLSAISNQRFIDAAQDQQAIILISHWRKPGATGASGTATDWIVDHYDRVIEINCTCAPDVATQRFVDRNRHVGHCDKTRTREEIAAWMTAIAQTLPLGVGSLITVDSEASPDIAALSRAVQDMLDR